MRFAILTPSRGRTAGLKRFFDSINKTVSGLHEIDLIIGIDRDDPERSKYIKLLSEMRKEAVDKFHIIMIEDDRKPLAKIWNSLIRYSKADWFTCGNDDEQYLTPKWDDIFYHKSLERHPYHLYWFDDGLQHSNHCAFPILSKDWIKAVGYFFPEIFIHNYVDTWVYDIACKLKVSIYIPEVLHQHLHHSIGMSEYDTTYAEGMAGDSNTKDMQVFIRTESERNKVVELLKSKIWTDYLH
jgi:hypothetical protein